MHSLHILCNGTLHAGTKPDYILCVHVQAYWAHLDHVVFKKESLSVSLNREATAQKDAYSLTVDSICEVKVGAIAVHSLCIACLTSHNRKTASQHHVV